jgi:streptomycin 6-kinase
VGDRSSQLPETVRRKAHRLGRAGSQWLDDLDSIVDGLAAEWGLTVGRALDGGTSSFVANASTRDGVGAVVKIAFPDGLPGENVLGTEAACLRHANGVGYARLLAYDETRRAMLLERLGRPLHALGWTTRDQLAVICATLRQAWTVPPLDSALPTGADKARRLASFIATTWEEVGRPCSVAVVERALEFARRRGAAFEPSTAVFVHGDAHGHNTLEDLTVPPAERRFKFVDPDGLFAERAYDLAIPMREFNDDLLGDDALALGRERCRYLGELTGVDPHAIWEWGFVERVSTGLYVTQVGNERSGREFLDVAEQWVAEKP